MTVYIVEFGKHTKKFFFRHELSRFGREFSTTAKYQVKRRHDGCCCYCEIPCV